MKLSIVLLCVFASVLFFCGCVNESVKNAPIEVQTNGACYSYKWKDRSVSPKNFIDSISKEYLRALCEGKISLPLGPKDSDSLSYYNKDSSMKNAFVFLMGLGMRESSGIFCAGRDASASNTKSESAEAGVFQISWDSHYSSPILNNIFRSYQQGKNCHKEYLSSITCKASDNKTWGDSKDDGGQFQILMKTCPAFAIEYGEAVIRLNRRHFGPINRKEVEFNQDCLDLLSGQEKAFKADPSICKNL